MTSLVVHSTRGHDAVLVVQLDAVRPHLMADACPLNPGAEIVANLAPIGPRELAAEKRGHLFGLDCMHGRADNVGIQGLEVGLPLKQHVGGILSLQEAPMVARTEPLSHRTELLRPSVQTSMKLLGVQSLGQPLGPLEVRNLEKSVVGQLVRDAFLVQPVRQPLVSVEIHLQAKRRPRGYPYVAQPEDLVDEVEVVMQALARRGLESGALRVLVVPGTKRRAGLHGREDVRRCGPARDDDPAPRGPP